MPDAFVLMPYCCKGFECGCPLENSSITQRMKLEIEKFFKHPFFTTVGYISQWVVLGDWLAHAIHTAKDLHL